MNIEIHIPPDERDSFVHCFRNFGEEVYMALKDDFSVSLEEIDSSTDRFCIREIPKSSFERVRMKLENISKKHFFDESLEICEIKAEQSP